MVSRLELAPWSITIGGQARIARADVDDVERRARNLDHLALRGIGALQDKTPACVISARTASAATTIIVTFEMSG